MSTDTASPATKAEADRNVQLAPGRMKSREFENQDHCVTAEQGVTIDDVMRPEFWAHVAPQLRPYDEVRVRTDDGTFYARLLVLTCGRNWAKVHELDYHQLTSKDVDMSQAQQVEGFEVKWRGPHCKWSVVRKAPPGGQGQVLNEKMDSEADARTWLAGHIKATA